MAKSKPDKGNLAGLASRALGWSFLSTALSKLCLTGFGVLLARLLGPSEFGTAAVAWVALAALLSLNELGVSLAIVRWPGEPKEIASTVATISVVMSLLLYVGMFLGAPAFARAMGAPTAAPVVRVLALSVVTNGVVSVPAALLERYFLQGRKMIADQLHGWLGALVSVGLGLAGFGAMSIAVGAVAGAVAGTIAIVTFSPLPLRFGFDRAKARQLLRFGLPLAGSSLIVFLVGNVDNFVVGHVLGATDLGFYVLAWNLASFPVAMFSQPVRSVAPAMFSRLQHDPVAMRTGFSSAAALLGAVTLPFCLLLGGAAVPLIGFVYGAKWLPAAHALLWLALLGALRVLFELSYDYFVVLARSRVVFTVQLVWLIVLTPVLILGARHGGVRGVAMAGVAVATFVVLPWYLIELRRVGIRLGALARGFLPPLVTALVVGTAASVAAKAIPNYFLACAAAGVAALIAIGLLAYWMRPAIKLLRSALSQESAAVTAAASANAMANASGTSDRATAGLRPDVSRMPDPALQAAALRALLALSLPLRAGAALNGPLPALSRPVQAGTALTGPLPVFREVTGVLPIYREAVDAVRWDPGTPRRRTHDGRGPAESPGRAPIELRPLDGAVPPEPAPAQDLPTRAALDPAQPASERGRREH